MFVTRLVKKRRDNRLKISSTMDNQCNTNDESSKESSSLRKIQSMDISRLKRRLVETMKSIASPRRKKEAFAQGDSFFSRISQLLVSDSSRTRSEKQFSNEVEQLYKNNDQTTKNDAEDTSVRQKVAFERTLVVSKNKNDGWRRFSLLLVGNRGTSSSLERRKLNNGKSMSGQTWRKSVQVDKLCNTSKTIVNPCRKTDRYQTEPLVVPDTPDTPGDTLETRVQTSDLTVLLADS